MTPPLSYIPNPVGFFFKVDGFVPVTPLGCHLCYVVYVVFAV